VDDLLTVYLAFGSDELVGCKIKGVKHILRAAGDFEVSTGTNEVRLGLFLFIGAALAREEEQRKRYTELAQLAKNATLDAKELQLAAS
jgi:hypothetical protein